MLRELLGDLGLVREAARLGLELDAAAPRLAQLRGRRPSGLDGRGVHGHVVAAGARARHGDVELGHRGEQLGPQRRGPPVERLEFRSGGLACGRSLLQRPRGPFDEAPPALGQVRPGRWRPEDGDLVPGVPELPPGPLLLLFGARLALLGLPQRPPRGLERRGGAAEQPPRLGRGLAASLERIGFRHAFELLDQAAALDVELGEALGVAVELRLEVHHGGLRVLVLGGGRLRRLLGLLQGRGEVPLGDRLDGAVAHRAVLSGGQLGPQRPGQVRHAGLVDGGVLDLDLFGGGPFELLGLLELVAQLLGQLAAGLQARLGLGELLPRLELPLDERQIEPVEFGAQTLVLGLGGLDLRGLRLDAFERVGELRGDVVDAAGPLDVRQGRQVRLALAQAPPSGLDGGLEPVERPGLVPHRLGELLELLDPQRRRREVLIAHLRDLLQLRLEGPLRRGGGVPFGARELLDPPIGAVPQEVLEDLAPVGGRGVQELGELALRQQHALGELVERQPHDPLGGGAHRRGAPRERPAQALDELGVVGRVHPVRQLLQSGHGGLDVAVLVASQDPGRHVVGARGGEHQPHPPLHRRRGDRVLRGVVAPPRRAPVQREAHRVEHRGLARAGGAGEREEVDVGEVERRGLGVGTEAVHVQAYRPHQVSSAATVCVSSYSSANSFATAGSSCPVSAR